MQIKKNAWCKEAIGGTRTNFLRAHTRRIKDMESPVPSGGREMDNRAGSQGASSKSFIPGSTEVIRKI